MSQAQIQTAIRASFAVLCLVLATVSAHAADTFASLTGFVKSTGGEGLSAEITVLHVATGVSRTTNTGDSGVFHASGLRIGGPYQIEVTASGYRSYQKSEVTLQPGTQPTMWIELVPNDAEIPELVATGSALTEQDLHNGVGSSYTSYDINNTPSINRDVLRTLNRDPLAHSEFEGQLNVAGVNPRFNGLAIDGSLQQDDFGLSDNTYASSRSPINLDAIESVSLVASDYSVLTSGFTGGLVNIITKSGTNEFSGTAYHYTRDQDWIGDTYDGDRSFTAAPFDETERGFTLGFPILQDKLFAFVSYDEFESSSSSDFNNFDDSRGIQPGFFDALQSVVIDTYGFDPGSRPKTASTPVISERQLAKLDWNVNENHRASFTYQSTVEHDTSASSSRLPSAWIDIPFDLKSFTGQVFSDWSDQLSTVFRYNLKENMRGQNCRGGKVGHLDLYNISAEDVVGTPLEGLITDEVDLTGGCDRFRHANAYNDERSQMSLVVNYLLDDHLVQFGGELETFELYNLFIPSSNGRFTFNSFSDFLNKTARVDYVNVSSNNAIEGATTWSFDKRTLFAQDTWYVNPDLDVTYGFRYEFFSQKDKPAHSGIIRSTYGVTTDNNLSGMKLLLPRASFRYTGFENTEISAGIGLFSGGDPKVWTSNAFQKPTAFARQYNATNVDILNVPQQLRDRVSQASASVPIDYISDGFEPPSDWKMSLRVDHMWDWEVLPTWLNEIQVTGQILSTRTKKGFKWTNLAQTQLAETQPRGVAPDGRPIYANLDALDILNLTELGNFTGGSSHVVSIAASKYFPIGLDVSMSYAIQDIEVVTEGTSSRGISNWRNIADPDRNNPGPHGSPYEKTHSLKTAISYSRNFGRFEGRVDLFSRIVTGSRFSFVYDVSSSNPLFGRAGAGESPYDNDPLYIPNGRDDPRVVYTSAFDVDDFFLYIDRYDLDPGIAPAYNWDAGLNQFLDLRLQATLPIASGFTNDPIRLVMTFDIENLLNFLNEDWGTIENGPSFGAANIVRADLISVEDLNANGVEGARSLRRDDPRTTCVQETDCVYRYYDFDADRTSYTSASRSVYEIRLGFRVEF